MVDIGDDTLLTCANPQLTLSVDTMGSNNSFDLSWSTMDGNILGDLTQPNVSLDQVGTYILEVTNTLNGCVATDTLMVGEDMVSPTVDPGNAFTLNCRDTLATLGGNNSSQGVRGGRGS